jgi:phosphatidylserine decarboxylase
VRPDYVNKHKDVFKENERVSVLGQWHYGFFSMSFIGALNVGSICLLFDDALKTNLKSPKDLYITDRNY